VKLPFVWRRTAEAGEQVWKDRVEYWRERAEAAERRHTTKENALRTASRQFSDLFDQHQQLTRDHARLIAQTPTFDDDSARTAAERIAHLQSEVTRARAEAATETRRANRLQQRLDDAVGLGPRGIANSGPWQPGYRKPKEDAK
jgi:chromosome segregation ATPase